MKSRFCLAVIALLAQRPFVGAVDEVFDSDGVKIRYVVEGEGEPVVLIHGWMADSSMWGQDGAGRTKLEPPPGFQLIALDCRGHGQSDKPHDPEDYGPKMAADVVRLLDHLKIEKAHLVGYSCGAYLAGWVAANYPQRVRSLTYGGQAPLISRGEEQVSDSAEVEVFAKAVDEGRGLGPYILAFAPNASKMTEKQADAIARFLYGNKDVKAFAAVGRSFKRMGVRGEQLKMCQAPVLFIHGANESDAVKEHVASVRELLGRGEVKVIDGADHVTTLTKPEFGATVETFLRTGKVE